MKEHIGMAFAPGHLTAFFRTADSPEDPLMRGSLGSGICLSRGAYSRVTVKGPSDPDPDPNPVPSDGKPSIEILIDGIPREARVSRCALARFLADARQHSWIPFDTELDIRVETTLELPEGSGWGISGAGALSSVLALREALNLPYSLYEIATFAHLAELEHSTGLGDVAAQVTGGVPIRKRPGIPPHGFVDQIPVDGGTVVCLTLPEPLSTASVLSDPIKRSAIDAGGRVAVDGISSLPTMDMFFQLARKFTFETGIADPRIVKILGSIGKRGQGGMAMLGNSIFAMGDTEALVELFTPHGRVDVCEIDLAGARALPSSFSTP